MRPAVTGAFRKHLRLNYLDDLWFPRVRLCINNMDARRLDAGNDQISPLGMWMRHIRTETSTARVPAEVMQFVARVGHVHATHNRSVSLGGGVQIDVTQGSGPPIVFRIQ